MDRRIALKNLGLMFGVSLIPGLKAAIESDFDPINLSGADLFTIQQRADIEAISEIIIPQTDTPGAREANVLNYIEGMFQEWFSADEVKSFLISLSSFQSQCRASHSKNFCELDNKIQFNYIESMHKDVKNEKYEEFAIFFEEIRQLTITGYYTSKVGMTIERSYLPTPGHYDGAYPYENVGTLFTS